MRSPAKTILLALLALATAVAITACGSSSDDTDATTGSNAPASTSAAPGQEAPIGTVAVSCKAGSSGGGDIRVTGVPCDLARQLVAGWHKDSACFSPADASRTSCKLGKFTCLGATTGRGVAVTCAGPGRSVAFIGKRPS